MSENLNPLQIESSTEEHRLPEMFYKQTEPLFESNECNSPEESKSEDFLRQCAVERLSEDHFEMGEARERGEGVFPSDLKAFEHYGKAFAEGDLRASVKLGVFYLNGRGVSQDVLQAIHYFKIAAEQDQSEACFYLGLFYFYGTVVKRDYLTSYSFFKKAVQLDEQLLQGHAFLAYQYLNGWGVDQNLDLAFEHTAIGIELNDPNAFYHFYLLMRDRDLSCYLDELEIPEEIKDRVLEDFQDEESVLHYFSRQINIDDLNSDPEYWNELMIIPEFWLCIACILGQSNALYDFGSQIVKEVDLEIKNEPNRKHDLELKSRRIKGYDLIEEAAESNHLDALLFIGREYKIKVPKSAVDYFGKATLLGSVVSRTELDQIYQNQKEDFSEKDYPSWDKAFARYHHPEGMYQWGLRLYLGNGVPQNIKEAFSWFLKSASTGYTDAIRRVIFCYEVGEGISKSLEKMNYWKSRLLEIEGNLPPQESQNL